MLGRVTIFFILVDRWKEMISLYLPMWPTLHVWRSTTEGEGEGAINETEWKSLVRAKNRREAAKDRGRVISIPIPGPGRAQRIYSVE